MSALTPAQLEEYSEPLNAMLRTFFSLQPKVRLYTLKFEDWHVLCICVFEYFSLLTMAY